MRLRNRAAAEAELVDRLSRCVMAPIRPSSAGHAAACRWPESLRMLWTGTLGVIHVRKLREPGQPERAIRTLVDTGTVVSARYCGRATEAYRREEIRSQL